MEQQLSPCHSSAYDQAKNTAPSEGLVVPIGIDSEGNLFYQDISKISHFLVSGFTGSGKTRFVQSLITYLWRPCSGWMRRCSAFSGCPPEDGLEDEPDTFLPLLAETLLFPPAFSLPPFCGLRTGCWTTCSRSGLSSRPPTIPGISSMSNTLNGSSAGSWIPR